MVGSCLKASTGLATHGFCRTRPSPGRFSRSEIVCRSGFGSENEKRGSSAKKKGRRKAPSGPSPKEQLKRLQEDEKIYREEMEKKYATSVNDTPEEEEEEEDAVVPEQITDRMLRRILLFSGGPLLLGMMLFPLFYYIKKVQGIDLPVWAVYIVQTGVFGGALVGISYGIVSASFDPSREGTLLGWSEFKTNLPQVLDSFKRKKN